MRILYIASVFIITSTISLWAYLNSPLFTKHFGAEISNETPVLKSLITEKSYNSTHLKNVFKEVKEIKNTQQISDADLTKLFCKRFKEHLDLRADLEFLKEAEKEHYYILSATCHIYGFDTEKNYKKAIKLYSHVESKLPREMRHMYARLLLKEGDIQKGVTNLITAAGAGDLDSQLKLATIYMNADYNVKRSYEKSVYYFKKYDKESGGKDFAKLNLAMMSITGRYPSNMTEYKKYLEQITPTEDKAIAVLYYSSLINGWGVNQNTQQGKEWAKKARTLKTNTSLFITDFFNEQGWGSNEKISKHLFYRYFQHGLITLKGKKDFYIYPDKTPKSTYTSLITTLEKDTQQPRLAKQVIKWVNKELGYDK